AGGPAGLYRVVIQAKPAIGQASFLFKGNKSDYRLTPPVAAQLTLPETGLCLAVTYASVPPAPRCTTNPAGTRLACK
ncbi:MAG TPA: hypothetical protein VEI94_08130, partial [Candidatus Bathyarchaeia archaeon]|nr:hypothetical protein [Candidatus Bathyarchaeia archaeon]